jgi:hypothetical protein
LSSHTSHGTLWRAWILSGPDTGTAVTCCINCGCHTSGHTCGLHRTCKGSSTRYARQTLKCFTRSQRHPAFRARLSTAIPLLPPLPLILTAVETSSATRLKLRLRQKISPAEAARPAFPITAAGRPCTASKDLVQSASSCTDGPCHQSVLSAIAARGPTPSATAASSNLPNWRPCTQRQSLVQNGAPCTENESGSPPSAPDPARCMYSAPSATTVTAASRTPQTQPGLLSAVGLLHSAALEKAQAEQEYLPIVSDDDEFFCDLSQDMS